MKKTVISFLLLLAAAALLASCGAKKSDFSMYDLSRAMQNAAVFGDMTYVSSEDADAEDLFAYVSDLDYGKVRSFFISYATDGKGNADEIAVIALKDRNDAPEAVASLEAHLKKRVSLYQTYDPSQSDKVEKGMVFSDGDLAVLIVCDDNDAVKTAFGKFIGNS